MATRQALLAKTALVLLADGVEEMEAVITMDVLRRAEISVVVCSVKDILPATSASTPTIDARHITCSRGVQLVADTTWSAVSNREKFDVLVLPGGMAAAKTFTDTPAIQALLQHYASTTNTPQSTTPGPGPLVALLCASVMAVVPQQLFSQHCLTSHPSVQARFPSHLYTYVEDRVVVDRNLVTSRGPGTAMEFAMTLVELLGGKELAQKVGAPMILP